MPKPKVYNEVEEAAALKKRFPDLSDQEVLDFLDDLTGNEPGYTNPNSVAAHVWLIAYDGGVKAAKRHAKYAFGWDIEAEEVSE